MAKHPRTLAQLKKHYPTATFIHNWDELKEYAKNHKSPTHVLKVKKHSGGIFPIGADSYIGTDAPKNCKKRDLYKYQGHCLSTHTFYGQNYAINTKILQKCGFNVVLDNWDKKEEQNGKME